MFDIGFWEIGLIAIIALIVLGPERLPKVIAKVGFWVGRIRAQALDVRGQIEQELGTDELREALHRQEQELHNVKVLMEEAREKMEQPSISHEEARALLKENPEQMTELTAPPSNQDSSLESSPSKKS